MQPTIKREAQTKNRNCLLTFFLDFFHRSKSLSDAFFCVYRIKYENRLIAAIFIKRDSLIAILKMQKSTNTGDFFLPVTLFRYLTTEVMSSG